MTDTRAHILETSFRLFLKRGFDVVSMNELVKAAGLSKGAFYHYFSSKRELYDETLQVYFFSFFGVAESEDDGPASLREFVDDIYSVYVSLISTINDLVQEENGHVYYYLMLIRALKEDEKFRSAVVEQTALYELKLSEIIILDQRQGRIAASASPLVLARHFLALVEGIMIMALFDTRVRHHERFAEIMEHFLDQLKPGSGSE